MSRKYFSARAGKPQSDFINEKQLKSLFGEYYFKLKNEGYFQHSFGKYCVNNGYMPGSEGVTLKAKMIEVFGNRQDELDPHSSNIEIWYQDDVFDMIEFFYDYIAKPVDTNIHEWDGCGLHVLTAEKESGRKEWIETWNPILARLKPSFRLTNEGKVEFLPKSEGLKKLVDEQTPHKDPENIDSKVKRACNLFLSHNSTIEDKKESLRLLADVLEYLEKDIQKYLSNQDESNIFHIANRFGIRHHNENQQTQYNQEDYYPWIFYAYLATIDLIARLKSKG